MKLLYGTGNPAKAAAMQNRIAGLGIELISLQDLRAQGVEIPDVPETGNTPLENARDRKSTRLNSSHKHRSRMPSSA